MEYIYETHLHTIEASACSSTPGEDHIAYGNFYWTSSLGTETGGAFLLRTLQRVDNYYTTSHLDIVQAARTDKNQIRPVQSKN